MSKDRARLLDILDWARAATKEAAGRTQADFDTDENFFLAQVKRVEVVGETASRPTPDTCRLMPRVSSEAALQGQLDHCSRIVDQPHWRRAGREACQGYHRRLANAV